MAKVMKLSDFKPVIRLFEEIGAQIADWRSNSEARILYSEKDFKTEADRRAHNLIAQGLQELHPGVHLVSEESDELALRRPNTYWLVDPIDGTASWFNGYSGFVTQAAFIEDGEVLFGVIHAPVLGKTWDAMRGKGARLNGQKLSRLSASNKVALIDNTRTPHGLVRDIMQFFPDATYLESGSLGLKSVLVADGTADLFIKNVTVRDWDMAPAAVALAEVGAELSMLDGSPYVFDGSYEKNEGIIVARDYKVLKTAIDGMQSLGRNL